jgi:exopolysaccharide biosynthesis polyprenyl glycosylphosphotransferase
VKETATSGAPLVGGRTALPVFTRGTACAATLSERLRQSHLSATLILSDVVSVAAGSAIAVALRPTAMVTVLIIAALALIAVSGLPQRPSIALSTLEQIPWLVRRMATAYLLGVPLLLLTDASPPLGQAAIVAIAVVAARAVTHLLLRRRRAGGKGREPTLLVGDSETSRRFMRQMGSDPHFGLDFVGVIGVRPESTPAAAEDDRIGQLADVPALVEGLGVRRVIVGPEVPGGPERTAALRKTLEAGARVHLLPHMSPIVPSMEAPFGELVLGHPFVELVRPCPRGAQWIVKRVVDVVVASALLLLLSPLLAVVAVGVKRSSPGPILFRQPRIGRHGVLFVMYKFRTFPVDHVDVVHSLRPDACPLRFGRFLRRSSLDELPQLVNVVRGEMSLIGPRPERPHFVAPLTEQYPEYADRHRVRGGVTGLAQTMGFVGDTPIEDRIRLDNRYIDGWSLWQDVLIAGRTLAAIVRKAFH